MEDEDEQLKKLLATNFGRMKNDPNKQRKVAVQYVELCGNSRGGDRKSNSHCGSLKLSQLEIAQQLGVSETELNRMLEIERKLTPDIKDLLDTGIISKTSASKIWTKLSEDDITKDLLETNIRQRGDIGGSSVKTGRRIRELERLYGVRQGSAYQKAESTLSTELLNQEDLINQLGMSKDTYLNYKKLTTLIPELQDMVDDKISFSVASRVLSRLTQEEQQDLINTYGKETIENLSMAKAKDLIDGYKDKELQAAQIATELATKNKELNQLKN